MASIDLFVCIAGKAGRFAELSKKISSKLLSDRHSINWKYISSGKIKNPPEGFLYSGSVKIVKKYCSSFNHGTALNEAYKVSTENYVIMLDSDFIFLCKDWDDIIVNNLKNIAAFGPGSPKGVSRACNFPFAYCFCYNKSNLKGVDLDFLPLTNKGKTNIRYDIVQSQAEIDVIGLPKGSKFRWETSSKIPFLFYDNNFESKTLKCVLGNSSKVKLPFLDDNKKERYLEDLKKSKQSIEHMEEWHYKKELFGTHFRASRLHKFKGSRTQYWVERINTYLKNRYDI